LFGNFHGVSDEVGVDQMDGNVLLLILLQVVVVVVVLFRSESPDNNVVDDDDDGGILEGCAAAVVVVVTFRSCFRKTQYSASVSIPAIESHPTPVK
jgi:hypothetical protein